MVCRYPLKWRYDHVKDMKYIAELFQDTLAIPNASIRDLLLDLEECYYSDYCTVCFDHICNLYRELDQRRTEMDSKAVEDIRYCFLSFRNVRSSSLFLSKRRFEDFGFIFYEEENDREWYKPSECLWSTVTGIKGMVSLNGLYNEDLKNFFVELLGIRPLTLQMVHDELVEQATGKASIHDVKETIWLFNSYLQDDEEVPPSPKQLTESKTFPVKYPNGPVNLCSSTVGFAIKDRKYLSDLFSGKAKFLDFDVNDTPRLEPFLRWAGLETRYLSSCIKEISALCSDYQQNPTSPDRKIAQKAYALLR